MTIHGQGTIQIVDDNIENVEKFKFLGSYVTPEGESKTEITIRLAMAKSTTSDLTEIWKSKELSLKVKVKLAKALIWSVALYGCESWTLKKEEERMVDVFEMWLWRRVLRVSWKDRKTNSWVRNTIGVPAKEGLLETIKKRKLSKYDHWKRRSDSLVLATIEGEVGAKGKKGRRRAEWIDDIRKWRGGMDSARRVAVMRSSHGSTEG